jgi:HTH-type transcriptional regulator/antitoxin HigA
MDPPDPIEAIRFRMEQQGLTRRDLEPMIGPRNRVADVLNRKRGLSIDMIRQLHDHLGISAEVLIRPSRFDKVA